MKYTQDSLLKYLDKKKKEILAYGMQRSHYYDTSYDWVNGEYFNWDSTTHKRKKNPRIGSKPSNITTVLSIDLRVVVEFIIKNTVNVVCEYDTNTISWWYRHVVRGGGKAPLTELMGEEKFEEVRAKIAAAETLNKSIRNCINESEDFAWFKTIIYWRSPDVIDIEQARRCFSLLEEIVKTYIAVNQ